MGAEQLRAPLVHDVVPVWHAETLHVAPVVQETHEPLLQTMLVPHDVPFMTFVTLLVHADTPVAHDVVPVWQAETLQAVPVVHVVHWPLSQTMPLPHAVPLVTLLTLAVHADVPVAHEVSPVWQADGAHAVPDVHATHAPLSQTWLLPQAVPLATFVAPVHIDEPLEQSVVPVWQTLPPGLQFAPVVHAPHVPLLQT
jgi:hypothetical protein